MLEGSLQAEYNKYNPNKTENDTLINVKIDKVIKPEIKSAVKEDEPKLQDEKEN
jgi:hypothetical protein